MFGGKTKMLPPTKTTRSESVVDTVKIKSLGWKPVHTLKKYIEDIKNKK